MTARVVSLDRLCDVRGERCILGDVFFGEGDDIVHFLKSAHRRNHEILMLLNGNVCSLPFSIDTEDRSS